MRVMAPTSLLLTLGIALVPLSLLALMMGPVWIQPAAVLHALTDIVSGADSSQESLILFSIRLPRVLLAALVGVCLAVCGTAMQGLFRNPLADPSLIGVSSGASAGASLMIVLGGGVAQIVGVAEVHAAR